MTFARNHQRGGGVGELTVEFRSGFAPSFINLMREPYTLSLLYSRVVDLVYGNNSMGLFRT